MPKLGILSGREYWLEDGKVFWRIPDIRECVRARPGWKILCSDLSQIEVKLMAFESQDPFLIGAINSGKDIHSYMTCDIFSYELSQELSPDPELRYDLFQQIIDKDYVPVIQKVDSKLVGQWKDTYKERRAGVKRSTFGIPYGANAPRIGMMIQRRNKQGRPIESIEDATKRAESIIEKYFVRAHVLKRWLDTTRALAIQNGYSASPRGRQRLYAPIEQGKNYRKFRAQVERWAGNQQIQSGNVDILKLAMANIWLKLRGGDPTAEPDPEARIILAVHDEIGMMCPDENVKITSHTMEEGMTEAYNAIKRVGPDGQEVCLSAIKNSIKVVADDCWSKD